MSDISGQSHTTDPDGMDSITLKANSSFGFMVRAAWLEEVALSTVRPGITSRLSFERRDEVVRDLGSAMRYLKESLVLTPEAADGIGELLYYCDAILLPLMTRSVTLQSGHIGYVLTKIAEEHSENLKMLRSSRNDLLGGSGE